MNIQTTNFKPEHTTIQIRTDRGPELGIGGLFTFDGRIWRALAVSAGEVTGQWVPNAEVTRSELSTLVPLVPTQPTATP